MDFLFGPDGQQGTGDGEAQWTQWLCEQDSDGDGWTNGEELGDPFRLRIGHRRATGAEARPPFVPVAQGDAPLADQGYGWRDRRLSFVQGRDGAQGGDRQVPLLERLVPGEG